MADPITGLETSGSQETVVDYLGRPAPLSFKGQPALPVGGPAVGAPAAPATPGGTGAPASVPGAPGSRPETPGSSRTAQQALAMLQRGTNLGDIARSVFGPSPAAFDHPLTELGLSPDQIREVITSSQAQQFPLALEGAQPGIDLGLVGAEEASSGASVAAETTTAAAGTGAGAGASVVPYLGAALTAAQIIADLAQGKDPGQVFLHMNPHSDDLTKAAAAATTAVLTYLGGPIGFALSGLIPWGAHTKGSDVMLPGFSEPVHTHTAGGTKTLYKSYGEGIGAIPAFTKAISDAKTPEDIVAALNQPYSPIPGQFQIYATEPGGTPQGIRNYDAGPGTRRFTLEDLSNPALIASLGVQAGALGAPAEQPDLARSLQEFVGAVPSIPVGATPGEPAAGAGLTPMSPAPIGQTPEGTLIFPPGGETPLRPMVPAPVGMTPEGTLIFESGTPPNRVITTPDGGAILQGGGAKFGQEELLRQ